MSNKEEPVVVLGVWQSTATEAMPWGYPKIPKQQVGDYVNEGK
jgi:hypothetical protein